MEFSFLYSIPRSDLLNNFFLIVTKIAGSYGQLWLVIGALLLAFKKTRKAGAAVIVSYVGVYVFGQMLLKHLIARPRPCHIDQTFALLVDRPGSSSFPSTHSAWAFGGATAIFMNHKRAGLAVLFVAALIAFSRLYLFLHFPTDVLAGIALGVCMGFLGCKLCDYAMRKLTGTSLVNDRK